MFKTRETALKHIKQGDSFWTKPFSLFHEDREMIFQAACEVYYFYEFERRARDWLWNENLAVGVLEERVKRQKPIPSELFKYIPEENLIRLRSEIKVNREGNEALDLYCSEPTDNEALDKTLSKLLPDDIAILLQDGLPYARLPLRWKCHMGLALKAIDLMRHPFDLGRLPKCLRRNEWLLYQALQIQEPDYLPCLFDYPIRKFLANSEDPIRELKAKLMAHELDAQLSVKVEVKKTQKI